MRYLLLLMLCTGISLGEQVTDAIAPIPPPPKPLPNLPQATMSVPWTDFKALIEELQEAKRDEAREKEKPKPPVPWTVAEARYVASAPESSSVRIEGTLTILVYQAEGWTRIPVLGNTVGLATVQLDGNPAHLVGDQPDWLTLLLDTPGEHTLTVEFYVNATSQEGIVSFEFPCAEAPVTHMTLTTPAKDATVRSPMATNITIDRNGDGLRADLAFKPTKSIAVQYTLPAEMPAAPAPVEPRVACTAWTLTELTENYVACRTLLRYAILRGSVDSFELRLPNEANLLDAVGQGVAWSQNPGDDGLAVDVKLNHRVEDAFDLEVTYEMPYDGDDIHIPDLSTPGVVREAGYTGIIALGNVEIGPGEDLQGLTRIDAGELPVELRALSPKPILLAFRYTEGARSLPLLVRRLEDVPMPDSTIERANHETVVTEDGMAVTRSVYDVRNSVRQFLRVELDPDAEVWSASVGGQVVKPARDGKSGAVLIPLYKSVEIDRRLGSFPVELLYMTRVPAPKGLRNSFDLHAPATDIMAGEVSWTVLLPETRRLYHSEGDLKPYTSQAIQEFDMHRPTTRGARTESIPRLREGVERFFITDINNPAGSVAGGPSQKYQGPPLTPEQAGTGSSVSAIAGVLPVPINLPRTGVPYRFHTVLTAQGKVLDLRVTTYPQWIHGTLHMLITVALFSAGAIVVWALLTALFRTARKAHGTRLPVAVALAGIVSIVLLRHFLAISLMPVAYGALAAAALIVAPIIIRSVGSVRSVRSTNPQEVES
jgi:hypothetical protein